MKPPEFKTSLSVESDDEETAENYQNYFGEKRMVHKIPDFYCRNRRLEQRLCWNFMLKTFILSEKNEASKIVTVESGWFIV